jgi:hypothetical protein
MPDGIFSDQKSQFGYVLELLFGIFYCNLQYFTYFDIFYGHSVKFVDIWFTFFRFGIFYPEKSGNPGVFLAGSVTRNVAKSRRSAPKIIHC